MGDVTLDDIKKHFSLCVDNGLTIGEYEGALLHRLYRTIATHERKSIEHQENLKQLEADRDYWKQKCLLLQRQ